MIPLVMTLRIRDGKRSFGLWIPIFLVWMLLTPFVVLLTPLVLVAWLIMTAAGWQIRLLSIIATIFELLCSLRQMRIHVDSPRSQTRVDLEIW